MKQYKLIQEYPGSPKEGTIHWFKIDEFGPSSNSIWQGTNFYDAHPTYWQKVEEVDYEILSFICIDDTSTSCSIGEIIIKHKKKNNNHYKSSISKSGYSLDYLLKSKQYAINSIKRLSDGEVFTIGDFTTKGVIHKFEITPSHLSVSVGDQKTLLRTFDKLPTKTPLFTTEDGVYLFEGAITFGITNWKVVYDVLHNKNEAEMLKKGNALIFSTKEKAEEYIISNKPCLSIVELQKWFSEYGIQLTGLDRLREIVKSKL